MRTAEDNLARVLAGELDRLTPAEIAALEAQAAEGPEFAARLATVRMQGDDPLDARPATPRAGQWDAVWRSIESAGRAGSRRRGGGVLRLWHGLTAAAACVALAALLRNGPADAPRGWALQLSGNVEILDLRTFGDTVAAVDLVNDDSGAAIISLFDDADDSEGV